MILDRILGRSRLLCDLAADAHAARLALVSLPAQIGRLIMADQTTLLQDLAARLRDWMAGPYAALLQENADLRAYRAAKEQEDISEPAAAADAAAALNDLIAPVSEAPEVPVELPPVEVPEPSDDAVPADGAADGGAVDGAEDPELAGDVETIDGGDTRTA